VAILIPYGSSELSVGVDGTIGIDLIPVTPINYSTISTNYSTYAGDAHLFDGYSSSGLYSYYKGLLETYFGGVYCKLTGCTMSGDLDILANLTATNGDFSGDVSANQFIGNGSLLTGIDGDNSSWNESLVDTTYVPYLGSITNVDLGNNNLTVNISTLFVNINTGRIGIGTTTPDTKLNVKGNASFTSNVWLKSNYSSKLASRFLCRKSLRNLWCLK